MKKKGEAGEVVWVKVKSSYVVHSCACIQFGLHKWKFVGPKRGVKMCIGPSLQP